MSSEFNELTDRLKESEERRRQFVSDASHELKTPLTSIKLLSDSILQNDMDQETIREFVDQCFDPRGAIHDRFRDALIRVLEEAELVDEYDAWKCAGGGAK